jgi:pimeloyl-ACP methyl ester carboxylesterase
MKDLVVLLPGILGSVLKRDGRIVWGYSGATLARALISRGNRIRDDLTLHGDDPLHDDLGDGVTADSLMPDLHLMPGFWKIDGYSAVAETLRESFELTPGLNYFEFPYDWRRDNRVHARKLARAVHKWLADWRAHGAADAKVIFIAHSMGGLVARYYLEVLGGWKDGTTRALITFGTPFRGSLNAFSNLANGIRLGPAPLAPITDVCRSLTSTYQLLPIFPCYDAGDGVLQRVGEAQGVPHVDAERARAALAFHHEIRDAVASNRSDTAWEADGYDLYPIVGYTQQTDYVGRLNGSSLLMSREYQGRTLGGDGTVPRVSAVPLEFDDHDQGADMYASPKHGSLQNARAVLDHLVGRVTGLDLRFGAFRGIATPGPARSIDEIAIEAPDVVTSDEPAVVRARAPLDSTLTFTLYASRLGDPIHVVEVPVRDNEWVAHQFEPLPEGSYRVVVSGAGKQATEEAFAVAGVNRVDAETQNAP